LARLTDRPVWVHGAIETLTRCYRQAGIALLPTRRVGETVKGQPFVGELVLAPPASGSSLWMRRFGRAATAFASGWMRVRGTRRRRGVDRGFVISDHADWPDLLRTIADTGASRVLTTHGYSETLARYLRQQGLEAGTLATPFEGEEKGETGGET
jgi:putative mRNA 3-end processing factor